MLNEKQREQRKRERERVKEKRKLLKKQRKKKLQRDVQKNRQKEREAGDYTLSVTGTDVKYDTSLVAGSVSISVPDRSSFDIERRRFGKGKYQIGTLVGTAIWLRL